MADTADDVISAVQSRAGRALLDWSQQDLAKAADLSAVYVKKFEAGERQPSKDALGSLRKAMEAAGVEFIPENGGGAGVRLAKRSKTKGRK